MVGFGDDASHRMRDRKSGGLRTGVLLAATLAGLAAAQAEEPQPAPPPQMLNAALRTSAAPEPAALPASPGDDAVMLRMLASEDVAVPMEELGDALATTSGIAARSGAASPPAQAELPPMAAALAPEDRSADGLLAVADAVAGGQAGRIVSSVNLRAKPSGSAGTLTVLASNAPVRVIGCKYWCEIEAAGKRGFVSKRFVKVQ